METVANETANQGTEGTQPVNAELDCTCLDCGQSLDLSERLLVGEVIECGECKTQLEVVEVDPPRVGPFARIEEEEQDFSNWG